jgi:hypothetical protein
MGKTDDILKELMHQRDIQGKIFDKIEAVKDDVNSKHTEVIERIGCLTTKVEVHKAKTSIWGMIGGAIPSAAVLGWLLIKEFFKRG